MLGRGAFYALALVGYTRFVTDAVTETFCLRRRACLAGQASGRVGDEKISEESCDGVVHGRTAFLSD